MIGNGLKWISLIMGMMIGAGYASGRELWQFFGGESGLAILLFAVLFIICIYVILHISYENQTTHYLPVLEKLVGTRFTKIYDMMLIVYLFSVTAVMIAGGVAALEMISIPYKSSLFFICAVIIIVFVWDLKGMTSLNSALMPLLMGCLFAVLFFFQYKQGFPITFTLQNQQNWPSAITFTALNILPILAVLSGIGKEIKSRGEIWIASIGSGLVVGLLTYLYNESLHLVREEIFLYEIPLYAIIKHFPPYMMYVTMFLLWSAIFTTAVTGMFGLISRIKTYVSYPSWMLALLFVFVMVPFSMIGFKNLIAFLYPLYGILNLYIISAILLYPLMQKTKISR